MTTDATSASVITTDAEMEAHFRAQDFKRLEIARERANKWTGSLSVLTGLVALVTIVKGTDAAKDLPPEVIESVSDWLAISFVLLALGVLLTYAAANGIPFVTDRVVRQPNIGLLDRTLDQIKRDSKISRALLTIGLLCVLGGLGALLIAARETWIPQTASADLSTCILVNGDVVAEFASGSITVTKLNNADIGPCP